MHDVTLKATPWSNVYVRPPIGPRNEARFLRSKSGACAGKGGVGSISRRGGSQINVSFGVACSTLST